MNSGGGGRVGFILITILATGVTCLAHAGHADHSSGGGGGAVESENARTKPLVTTEVRDGYRHITSSGLPDHQPGQFPNRNNPNTIAPQTYAFRIPLEPKAGEQPREAR